VNGNHYTITFPDGFGDEPLSIPNSADDSAIAAAVRDHLDPTGALELGVLVDLDAGIVHIDEQQATITCGRHADLLAAVERVIAAGHLDWDSGVDVDKVQGDAHAALIKAYQAVTR
jgi:hypothetical protein